MTVSIEDALLHSIAQEGERYVFGTEVPGTTSDRWDCSELVEVACRAAGIRPTVPDGAYYQWKHCTPITVPKGIGTRGALLFVGDGTGTGRDAITHVAWSLGNGTTVEARGSAVGVGVFPTATRFDFAGLVPGATYAAPRVLPVKTHPVIRKGSAGLAVAFLQQVLRAHGMKSAGGHLIPVTGTFGATTDYVVRAVQAWCGLAVDGIVGAKTWAVIDQLARG